MDAAPSAKRRDAKIIGMVGVAHLAGATALFGFAPSYETMVPLAILGGLGNSVFHPADYAIMSATVSPGRRSTHLPSSRRRHSVHA